MLEVWKPDGSLKTLTTEEMLGIPVLAVKVVCVEARLGWSEEWGSRRGTAGIISAVRTKGGWEEGT